MHALFFNIGDQRYAIDAHSVAEVLPCVDLTPVPKSPDFIAGLMNYRGEVVPVVELGVMLTGRPCRNLYSTRLILLLYPTDSGALRRLGIIAESVLSSGDVDAADFVPSGVQTPEAPCLGKVSPESRLMVRLLEVGNILTDDARARLFQDEP